jgi:signal transduction histidine kinase
LRNLISNAVKFSFPNSSISLLGRNNYLAVIDEGTGIKEEKIGKLFKQKLMPEFGTELEGGFGIGLYLCYELLRKHKAIMSVSNNSDKGTTFTITPEPFVENRDSVRGKNNSNL